MTAPTARPRARPPEAPVAAGRAAAPVDVLPVRLREGLSLPHLPSLDGIRMLAAFTVVVYHAGILVVPAGMGVLAFFVLSGFIITWLLLREDELAGTVSLKKFYARRSLRIFPAFFCYWLLVIALLVAMGKRVDVGQAAASFLYVNNYYQAISGDPNTLLSHTWSLGVEEQFYLLWPVAFIALRHNRPRLAGLLVTSILALWAYRLTLVLIVGVDHGYVYEAFDTRADHLLVGCLLAVALRTGRWPRLWRALAAGGGRMLLTTALLGASVYAASRFGVRYQDTIGFIVDPLLIAALIVQSIAFHTAPAARWLNWGWMRYLGAISYPVYLYHPLTVAVSEQLPAAGLAVRLLVVLLLTTVVASGSYFLIERPVMRLKGRFARPLARAEMPAV